MTRPRSSPARGSGDVAVAQVAGFALLLALIVVVVVAVTTYNAVVGMQRRVDKAWANIDVILRQRHDELPALVDAVRGALSFERTVLSDVTRARAGYVPEASPAEQGRTSATTSAAVRSLFGVMERYPDLRAEQNVSSLQAEIERLEELIATRRELYNDTVYLYDAAIAQLPGLLFARFFGWTPREYFEAREPVGDRVPVSLA